MDNKTYLDQISSPKKPANNVKTFKFPFKLIKIFFAILAFVLIVIVAISMISKANKPDQQLIKELHNRINNNSKILVEYSPKLSDINLRALSNSLISILNSANYDLVTIEANHQSDIDEKSNVKVDPVDLSHINKRLDNAILNNDLDKTFKEIYLEELNNLLVKTSMLEEKNNQPDINNFIRPFYNNLNAIKGDLERISL